MVQRPRSSDPSIATCAVVIFSCWIAYADCRSISDVPHWKITEQARQTGPLDPSVRYLSVHTMPDVFDIVNERYHDPCQGIGEELYFGCTSS